MNGYLDLIPANFRDACSWGQNWFVSVSFSLILHYDVCGDEILISGSCVDQLGKTDHVVVFVT